MPLYEAHDFFMGRKGGLRQFRQQGKDQRTVAQIPAGDLADDQWMAENSFNAQQIIQAPVMPMKMGDPHRRIHQDHVKTCGGGQV